MTERSVKTTLAGLTAVGSLFASQLTSYTDELIVVAGAAALTFLGLWWSENKGNVADEIEDAIEDVTSVEVEVDNALGRVADSISEIVEETLDAVDKGDGEVLLSDALEDAIEEEVKEETGLDIDINLLTLAELKDLCRAQGLKVSGKKAELVARLQEALSREEE